MKDKKLYRVKFEVDVVLLTDDTDNVISEAAWIARNHGDGLVFVAIDEEEVKTTEQLPYGWTGESLPYGGGNTEELTIKQILMQED